MEKPFENYHLDYTEIQVSGTYICLCLKNNTQNLFYNGQTRRKYYMVAVNLLAPLKDTVAQTFVMPYTVNPVINGQVTLSHVQPSYTTEGGVALPSNTVLGVLSGTLLSNPAKMLKATIYFFDDLTLSNVLASRRLNDFEFTTDYNVGANTAISNLINDTAEYELFFQTITSGNFTTPTMRYLAVVNSVFTRLNTTWNFIHSTAQNILAYYVSQKINTVLTNVGGTGSLTYIIPKTQFEFTSVIRSNLSLKIY